MTPCRYPLPPCARGTEQMADRRQSSQGGSFTRRKFIAFSGNALCVAVAASRALGQQATKAYRIGYLYTSSPASGSRYLASFRDALRRLGYVDGQNIAIEYRFAEGEFERLPTLASELVSQKPDVIVGFGGGQATRALKAATRTIPVVFLTDDPVAEGIVDSLAKPGGNLTGVSVFGADLEAKRVELIKETLPRANRLAALRNPDHPRAADALAAVKPWARGHFRGSTPHRRDRSCARASCADETRRVAGDDRRHAQYAARGSSSSRRITVSPDSTSGGSGLRPEAS
jgi:ABC-type sugar transport system substrate-binding protein